MSTSSKRANYSNRREFIAATTSAMVVPSESLAARDSLNSREVFRLPQGGFLGFQLFGDPSGLPVVYFHGSPSCRLEAQFFNDSCCSQGICLIAVDRFGMGCSSWGSSHSVCTWPRLIAPWLETIKTRFTCSSLPLLAMSGGTPFALACAAALPDIFSAVALISPRTPFAPGVPPGVLDSSLKQATDHPRLVERALAFKVKQLQRAKRSVKSATIDKLAAVDQSFAAGHEWLLRRTLIEAANCGTEGLVRDLQLIQYPWGICLGLVQAPVHIWWGSCDATAPRPTIDFLQANLTNTSVTVEVGAGHFSVIDRAGEPALQWLSTFARTGREAE